MEFKNKNKYYRKGKVFLCKKWGTLVKILEYFPPSQKESERAVFEEINQVNPKEGECFGDISRYLYDIDNEIDNFKG